ncbi:MAG: polysaccharide biosynthesis/export family protein [Spirochaetales bacterium]|nr:polysaccharide biosynthesis/export family protein [Spirochaetales bacterium]
MKKVLFTVAIFFTLFSISAQDINTLLQRAGEEDTAAIPQATIMPVQVVPAVADNLQLAISNQNYPVTPGDVYTLTFLLAGEAVSNVLLVESDYTINLTIFGKIDAAGMTFSQLKPIIEETIAAGYPRSLPSVTITAVGVFQVPVLGEIPESRYVTAWGLSRLSEVLENILGEYSSIRDIEIISANRRSKRYDLLKALNLGVLSENPNVSPGDTIRISRINREVQVLGEVYKPGTYQLMENEGGDEISAFTGGYTPLANLFRIKVDRFSDGIPTSFTTDVNQISNNFDFHNGDVITVPTIMHQQPVVYIEGGIDTSLAFGTEAVTDEFSTVDIYNRIVRQINIGETLYDILYSIKDYISPFADLEHGYLIRAGEASSIPVNMQKLIYEYNENEDIVLRPFDHIAIPLGRPFVSVTGAAYNPGRLPYNPPELYSYYVNVAGGFDMDRNTNGKVIITDENGNRKEISAPILPGDNINVLSNSFLYNFNQYFPAIATGLGLIITIITLTNALNQTGAP